MSRALASTSGAVCAILLAGCGAVRVAEPPPATGSERPPTVPAAIAIVRMAALLHYGAANEERLRVDAEGVTLEAATGPNTSDGRKRSDERIVWSKLQAARVSKDLAGVYGVELFHLPGPFPMFPSAAKVLTWARGRDDAHRLCAAIQVLIENARGIPPPR
ncbi:MAG: hypothetical protein HYZ53_15960 [Planctomycetes bacterium]|nr:hypothetical protein [Planctomycetota bacterium]